VPEPASKQRKTLVERATEPIERKLAAPPTARPVAHPVKGSIGRGYAASMSRVPSNKASNRVPASAFASSVGPGARVPSGSTRPKSAFSLHGRSKSHHQGMRPATAMKERDEDDEDEAAEHKGVHTFPIPTIPNETLYVPKNASPASKRRPHSLNVAPKRASHLSAPRYVSSPSNLRSISPVTEEPIDSDCDDICNNLGTLTLSAPWAVGRNSRVGRGTIPGKETNPFLKPMIPQSQLPRATPVRQVATPTPTPMPLPSSTPRTRAPFISRFTNDRCPDFYDHRMESMEREFRMFKDRVETDMRESTNYKEMIQQLQTRGTVVAMN
jgi:kinesin family protein C1